MKSRVILGGIAGGVVILLFAFFMVYLLNSYLPGIYAGETSWLIGLIPMILSSIAGGFLAGIIARPDVRKAGMIAGGLAGAVIMVAWVVIMPEGLAVALRGVVIALVVLAFARAFSGFARQR
jgi:hypothetical protein